jgi:hypothetical protein
MLLTVNVDVKAAPVTFNFDVGIENTESSSTISAYMSNIYGAIDSVSEYDGEVRDNQDENPDWSGKTDDDNFLRNRDGSGSFSITFVDVPITSVEFLAYIFETSGDTDFGLDISDSSNNPVSFTYSGGTSPTSEGIGYLHWNRSVGQFSSPTISFDSPVTKLLFHDGGEEDIGIDNLTVTPNNIPEPATIALLGLGVLSLIRRKRSV